MKIGSDPKEFARIIAGDAQQQIMREEDASISAVGEGATNNQTRSNSKLEVVNIDIREVSPNKEDQ